MNQTRNINLILSLVSISLFILGAVIIWDIKITLGVTLLMWASNINKSLGHK